VTDTELSDSTNAPASVSGAVINSTGTANSASAKSNSVSISGSEVNDVVGAHITGATATLTGNASGNAVSVTDSTVNDVFGGRISGAVGSTGNASNNTLNFSGATFRAGANQVIGGWVETGTGKANDNSIKFGGETTLQSALNVYGGLSQSAARADSAKGNLLHFNQFRHHDPTERFGAIGNFSEIKFTLPSDQDKEEPVVKVDQLDLDTGTVNAKITSVDIPGPDIWRVNDEITLFDSTQPIYYNGTPGATYEATGQ
jgi:hypothetical protein